MTCKSLTKTLFLSLAASVAALGMTSASALALANRAWVSSKGTDAAGCVPVATPCRGVQFVHDSIIAPGGEIDVMDSAGYGSIAINKALSIVIDGAVAGVQGSAGGASINITAGGRRVRVQPNFVGMRHY
jgi:hypothetical protein